MDYGASIWGPLAIGAASSLLTSTGKANKETPIQKRQRKLVDKLLSSLEGEGPYADLYSADEDVFQKSFVDPAKQRFQTQIAPQIQQSYIATGQQRGTGLEDRLTRAGVDLDQMLNQYAYQYQQDAMNRKQTAIDRILGAGSGAPEQTSTFQDIASGIGGVLGGDKFQERFQDYFFRNPQGSTTAPAPKPGVSGMYREGFTY